MIYKINRQLAVETMTSKYKCKITYIIIIIIIIHDIINNTDGNYYGCYIMQTHAT